mgnify:CR=1 FL=1
MASVEGWHLEQYWQEVISTGAVNIALSFAANYSQGSSASDALKLTENPFRSGSYGIIDQNTQKYFEVLRIDPPTPVGRKGPQYSHYHIYGSKEHYVPGYNDYWPW